MAVNNTIDSPKVSYPRKSNTTAVTELIAEVLEIVSFRIICEASPKFLFYFYTETYINKRSNNANKIIYVIFLPIFLLLIFISLNLI